MARATERNRQVVRQWEVLQMLEERPRSLGEITSHVGDGAVTQRTIRRDLEALQDARFPIFDDVDDDGCRRWRLLQRGVTPPRTAAMIESGGAQ